MAATLLGLAFSGRPIMARTPNILQALATDCPWLPVDAVIKPRQTDGAIVARRTTSSGREQEVTLLLQPVKPNPSGLGYKGLVLSVYALGFACLVILSRSKTSSHLNAI